MRVHTLKTDPTDEDETYDTDDKNDIRRTDGENAMHFPTNPDDVPTFDCD